MSHTLGELGGDRGDVIGERKLNPTSESMLAPESFNLRMIPFRFLRLPNGSAS